MRSAPLGAVLRMVRDRIYSPLPPNIADAPPMGVTVNPAGFGWTLSHLPRVLSGRSLTFRGFWLDALSPSAGFGRTLSNLRERAFRLLLRQVGEHRPKTCKRCQRVPGTANSREATVHSVSRAGCTEASSRRVECSNAAVL